MGVKNYHESWNNGPYWSNIGYPGSFAGKPTYTSGGAIWTTKKYSNDGISDGKVLGHFIDTERGHSGGPLYAYWPRGPCIVGIHSSASFNPAYTDNGDNQAAGGAAMLDLAHYSLTKY